jgi:hypothetical protein
LGAECERCANCIRALAHSCHAEVARGNRGHIETSPIVAELELDAIFTVITEREHRVLRARVFDNVVESFLCDSVERNLDLSRQRVWLALDRGADLQATTAGGSLGQLAEQVGQTQLGDRTRAQLDEQRPHLGKGATR